METLCIYTAKNSKATWLSATRTSKIINKTSKYTLVTTSPPSLWTGWTCTLSINNKCNCSFMWLRTRKAKDSRSIVYGKYNKGSPLKATWAKTLTGSKSRTYPLASSSLSPRINAFDSQWKGILRSVSSDSNWRSNIHCRTSMCH